jgi:hypothetical protein
MNITGILGDGDNSFPKALNADNVLIPDSCAMASRPPAFINVRRCIAYSKLVKRQLAFLLQNYMYIHVFTNSCSYGHIKGCYKASEKLLFAFKVRSPKFISYGKDRTTVFGTFIKG